MQQNEVDFRLATKAFIINKGKLFLVKRAENDVQSPGKWEVPGGRLKIGEDPILGLMREIREETGLYIQIGKPLTIRHFIRDDRQIITMINFICNSIGGFIKLSEEHSEYGWFNFNEAKEKITDFFYKEINLLIKD